MELLAGLRQREGYPRDYVLVSMQNLDHNLGDLLTYPSPVWLTVAEGWVADP